MKKVFAVLIFLTLLQGCSIQGNLYFTKPSLFLKEDALYSTSGDFDGDRKAEKLTILKEDNKLSKIKLRDGTKIYSKDLIIDSNNINLQLCDVNNDSCDDIVININENDISSMFIYTFSNGINTVFSPEIIRQNIVFKKIQDGYEISGNSIKHFIPNSANLRLKFYLSELDDSGDDIVSIRSEGMLLSDDEKIFSIVSIRSEIDRAGNALIKAIQVKPYKEININ